uniref:Nucleotid_trans domain-containing protein n=1 Tax=Steinernema glaseri TaxID=37863 RepID=A0A1I7Y8I1_9BILA
MDASVRCKKNSLEHIYDLLRCRRRPKARIYQNFTVLRDSALETGWNREVWRRNLRECSKVPYMFHSFTGHGIYAATHPDVYRFIPTNIAKLKAEKAKMYEAGLVFVVKTRDVVDKLLKWSVLCALQRECMGPVPFAAQCEFNGNDRYSTFAHCHRFDQSVINLLVANMAGYDRRFYASDIVDFFSIERHSPQQFNNLSLRCE